MDFYDVLDDIEDGLGIAYNPFAEVIDDEFESGGISIDWLNKHFGDLNNVNEMINRAKSFSEGTVLYFNWLKEKDILN